MKIKLYLLPTMIALLASLVACSDDDGESQAPPAGNSFVGSWATGCYEGQNGGLTSEYFTDEVNIESDLRYSGVFREYSEVGCTGNATRSEAYSGSYSLGNTFVTSDGVTATEFDANGVYDGEPEIIQQIIYRSANFLYFGLFEENSAEGTRPSRIDFERFFALQ